LGVPSRVVNVSTFVPGVVQCFPVVGKGNVPVGAEGVVVNVATVTPSGGGHVVVYPDTDGDGATPPPHASSVNFETGRVVANTAFVALPANGDVCVYSEGSTLKRLLIDVSGYFLPGSGVELQSSQRVLNTRPGDVNVGPYVGPLLPGEEFVVDVGGQAGVPLDAVAVLVNVTVTQAKSGGHLRMWETGTVMPSTSVVNFATGFTKASASIVALSDDGELSFQSFSSGVEGTNSVHVMIDVVGWIEPDSTYTATEPTRIVRTSSGAGVIGPIGQRLESQTLYAVPIEDETLVPTTATAVVLTVTAVNPSDPGHIRVYPDTDGTGMTPPPATSNINYIVGRAIPNLVVVQLPPNRTINFYNDQSNNGTTHLLVDIVGYIE
jgi:hypothetical protein